MIPQSETRRPQRLLWLCAVPIALVASGCGVKDIDSTYGKRRGAQGGASVNGTAVLAEMFEEAGHSITTRRYLSPNIKKEYDIIVWAPDDFEPPADDVQEFLEDWLYEGEGRTLVYIGRDYDATITYWEKVQPTAPPEQAVEVARRLAKARAEYNKQRSGLADDDGCRWFDARRDDSKRLVGKGAETPTGLSGAWANDRSIDQSALEIEIHGRLDEPPKQPHGVLGHPLESDDLLAVDNDVLVRRITCDDWDEGQIIVVTNGSFLLNLPLLEKEHRELAGKLIAECGPPGSAVFLESGSMGPPVFEQDPGENHPTGMEAFTVWPIGAILLHFVALGILYVFARAAIFGRPHELPPEAVSDFGRHIHALGDLLARSQDRRYAKERLTHYHEKVKRDSGASSEGGSTTNQANHAAG